MKILMLTFLALLLTACAASTEYYKSIDRAHYKANSTDILRITDEDGNFAGHINERDGRIYDRDGNFIGMIK